MDLPVINIKEKDREKLKKEIKKDCTETGFFYISNHGIDMNNIFNLYDEAKIFFNKSEEYKNQYLISNQPSHFGYVSFKDSGLYEDENIRLYEAFDISRNFRYNNEKYKKGNIFYGENNWKEEVKLKELALKYKEELKILSFKLCNLFEEILELPENYFQKNMNEDISQLRIIHYKENKNKNEGLHMGGHTDYELFTILYQFSEGLQTQNIKGEWVEAKPIKDTFVVNLGDLLEVISNGYFKSNMHRVINKTKERYSLPYFVATNYETVIKPMYMKEECNGYSEIISGEHIVGQIARDFSYLREKVINKEIIIDNQELNKNPYEDTVKKGS